MSDATNQHDPYAPWRSRNYRYFACSWFAMTFSKQVERLAVAIYFVSVYQRSEAPLALGAMGLVQALPFIALAVAGGQLADRFNRRRLMLSTFSLSVFSAAGLLAIALLHGSELWIYVFLGIGAIGQALGTPARAAMLPGLVPPRIFSKTVMWNSSVFYVASVTGPVAGGVIMQLSKDTATLAENPAPAFAVVLACRLIAVAGIALIRYRQQERSSQSISWQSVMAGIRFVWNTKLILATITLDLFAVLLGGATYLLPIYAKDILHVDSTGLGALQGADSVGAVCMAMMLAHRRPLRRAGPTLLWAVAGFGVATIIFGLSQWFWLSLLMMFLVGALDNISVVVRHTLVQMLTPDEMRGRVSAVNSVFIVASNDLGGLESGLTAWLFTPMISVVGGGVGTILVVLAAMRLWPQILRIGPLDAIQPVDVAESAETV